jgi:excisionase family DNA binding protein
MDSRTGTRSPTVSVETPWLRVPEAAQYVRVGPRLIYREVNAGRLRAARIGGRRELVLKKDWLDAWLERATTEVG